MSNLFVNSNAVGLNDGSNWANAYATLLLAAAATASGDTIAMAENHTETNGANTTYAFASNVNLTCSTVTGVDTITATKALNDQLITQPVLNDSITFNGTNLYIYGIQTSSSLSTTLVGSIVTEQCTLGTNTGGNNQGNFSVSSNGSSWLSIDDTFDAGLSSSTNASTFGYGSRTVLRFIRPTVASIRPKIFPIPQGGFLSVDGGDLSQCTSTILVSNSVEASFSLTNILISTSITTLAENTPEIGSIGIIEGVDSVSSVNRQYRSQALGELFSDTGIVLDATNPSNLITSNKIVTNTSAKEFFKYARFPVAFGWADFSTAKTIDIEFCQDGAVTPLTDTEIWFEFQYPDGTTAKYLIDTDRAANNQSGTNHAISTAVWSGLSGTSVKQKGSVTSSLTGKAGTYQVFVCLAKPNTTVYVNPKANIS